LAPVTNPALVLVTSAHALGLAETADRPLRDILCMVQPPVTANSSSHRSGKVGKSPDHVVGSAS
jgi:hypothetical protein